MAFRLKGGRIRKGKKSMPKGKARANKARPKPMNLKSIAYAVNKINSEKKEFNNFYQDVNIGQIAVSPAGVVGSGHWLVSDFLTPNVLTGTSSSTRVGNEISITGIYATYQFRQQANATQKISGKIYYITPKLSSMVSTMNVENILNPNYLLASVGNGSVYDLQSTFNNNYTGGYKILGSKRFSVSSDLASLSQRMVKQIGFGMKFKTPHKIRYNSANSVTQGQIYVLLVLDSGNSSIYAPTSTTGLAVTDTVSGLTMNTFCKVFYTDN